MAALVAGPVSALDSGPAFPANALASALDFDGDDEDDVDDAEVETGALSSIGAAMQRLRVRVAAQVRSALDQGTAPTQALGADRSVRMAFYTLLPPQQQRVLFLELMTEVDMWPRVRHLFGAPPYDFLEPGDLSRFAAAGFATGRANMAHDEVRTVASYSQYGQGQFRDAFRREYKIVRQGRGVPREAEPLLFDLGSGARSNVLIARARAQGRARSGWALADAERRRTVTFPAPGEEVIMRLTPQMSAVLAGSDAADDGDVGVSRQLSVRVERIALRGRSANTAAMVATIT